MNRYRCSFFYLSIYLLKPVPASGGRRELNLIERNRTPQELFYFWNCDDGAYSRKNTKY